MKKIIYFFVFVLSFGSGLWAQNLIKESPVKSLYSSKLDNGLSVFIAENHSVPLTYIEIAVKCGAYSQTPETAGLFHLYEHMMFKGNSLYKDAASVTNALTRLGVAEWNGTTDVECVNYFFTVPSDMTEQGLEFWNCAIRTPKMDPVEFENEKKVVLSEINANFSNQGYVSNSQINELLFPEAPYKLSSSGTEEAVSSATIKQLKAIQKKFYIPNNAAVFVGGDVNPDEVFLMIKKIFGSWKKGADPYVNKASNPDRIKQFSKNPFEKPVFAVVPYDKISSELAQVLVYYRGPDAYFEEKDTYAADILSWFVQNPDGIFKQTLYRNPLLYVPSTDQIFGSYYTRKTCGNFYFGIQVQNPLSGLTERVDEIYQTVPVLLGKVAENTSEEQIKSVAQWLGDNDEWNNQEASNLLSAIRFWWSCTSEDYFYNYNDCMQAVSTARLVDFTDRYFSEKAPLVVVYVNSEVYEKTKADYESKGYIVLGKSKEK